MNTKKEKSIIVPKTLASLIGEANDRRDVLRAEMKVHDDRQGNADGWYDARVDELHATTRYIHRLEDAQAAEQRERQPGKAKTLCTNRRSLTKCSSLDPEPRVGHNSSLPYCGALISAVVMDAISGYYRRGISGTDALCRKAGGEYFLVREVYRDDLESSYVRPPALRFRSPAFRLPIGRYWLRVKRLSLRAALCYASRDCDDTLHADFLSAVPPGSGTSPLATLASCRVELREAEACGRNRRRTAQQLAKEAG